MQINRTILLENMKQITEANKNAAEEMLDLPLEILNSRPGEGKWSALEAIEHLNRYGDFYIPELQKRFVASEENRERSKFRPGWLGKYFSDRMRFRGKGAKPMKTLSSMDPIGSNLDKQVIEKFIAQQEHWLDILESAHNRNLNAPRIPITISTLIRLKPGDIFRINVYHNQRHILQAQRAIGIQKMEMQSVSV